MDSRICTSDGPPWKWIVARNFTDPEFCKQKKDTICRIAAESPFYTESDVKLVRVASITLDMTVDIGIFRGMTWHFFKEHLMIFFDRYQSKISFTKKDIQDITITYSSHKTSPCIDEKKYDLFTVIPDNCVVFFSQIKIGDIWYFFK